MSKWENVNWDLIRIQFYNDSMTDAEFDEIVDIIYGSRQVEDLKNKQDEEIRKNES